jgi:hypothetical protein
MEEEKLMLKTITLLIFIALLITSCSPKIDTSSKNKMESSIEKVRQSLPENKRAEFDVSLQMLFYIQMSEYFPREADTSSNSQLNIDGKTGLEIITLVKNLEKKEREQERKKVMQKIKELENKKVSAEKEKAELAKFKLVSSRFYKQKEEYSDEELIIEFTMKNETNYPISGGYFIGTLASPNRSVPWLKKFFNYSISGGLEPGEEITLRLVPQYSSELNTINISQDAVFTIEVRQLNGVKNKPLFSACKFTRKDEKQLRELKESLRHKSISKSKMYDYYTTYHSNDCLEIEDDYDYRNDLRVQPLP